MSKRFARAKWTSPAYNAVSCGMEVNMYAPDEEEDVLFREAEARAAAAAAKFKRPSSMSATH